MTKTEIRNKIWEKRIRIEFLTNLVSRGALDQQETRSFTKLIGEIQDQIKELEKKRENMDD